MTTKVDVMGETVSFNINPVPEILPSEEICLSFSSMDAENTNNSDTDSDKNKSLDVSLDEDDFVIMNYENDYSPPGDKVATPQDNENQLLTSGQGEHMESVSLNRGERLRDSENRENGAVGVQGEETEEGSDVNQKEGIDT